MGWSCVAAGMRAGCVLVIMSTALSAAEIAATSKVDAVTVYPAGAEVVRTAKVRIEPGEHVVVLTDLPAQVVGASLRVEGKASGPLEIGAVDHRRLFVTRDADAETARRQLELEAEKLRDDRARLVADADAAEVQKTFVQNLAGLPTLAPQPGAMPGPQPDWNALYAMIGSRHAEAQQRALETRTKIRDLDRRIEDLTKKIAATAPRRLERTEVKVTVVAAGRVDADLLVRYQVTDAGWQPLYEARLESGARNVAPKLRLIRRATVRQRTGEPWNDVALTLSTARPTAGTAAPELRPVTVDVQLDIPRPAPLQSAAPATRGRAIEERAAGDAAKVAEAPPPSAPVVEAAATLETSAFSAAFAVRDRVTLLETGETKNVFVEEQTVEPTLVSRAVPRLDPKAYLYARIVTPRTAPYLPGPISLFRDRTFTGVGRLPALGPGETHELAFGADDMVRIRHTVSEEKRGEGGLISTTRSDERMFKITVRNMHERPISYSILDQIPVSQNQEIRVELLGRTAPSRRDVDDRRGVLAWEDRLPPDEERTIDFGYRVSWPANRTIVYGR